MVIFIIKNIRNKDIELGPHKLKPGDEFSIEQLNNDINAAGEKGDISITVTHENSKVGGHTPPESHAVRDGKA